MTDVTQGWKGYVRVKLEDNSPNWSNASGYAYDPYFTSVTLDSSVDMTKTYAIGTRTAIDTAEGVIDLTGSVERPLFDNASGNWVVWSAGQNFTHYSLPDVCGYWGGNVSKCCILLMPSGLNQNMTYVLHNAKFYDYSISVSAEDITKETASFTADNASTG